MNSKTNDSVSAFLDDELNPGEAGGIVARLAADQATRDTLGRYQLIRAGLRGEAIDPNALKTAESILERLASEPTVLTPKRQPATRAFDLKRGAAGLAIAASVAALAIVLFPKFASDGAVSGTPTIAQAPPAPSYGKESKRSSRERRVLLPASESAVSMRHLNALATDHNEMIRGGASGFMPYATFVSYNSAR